MQFVPFCQKVMGLIGLSYLDLRLLTARNVKKSGVKMPHKESHVSSVVKMVAYKLWLKITWSHFRNELFSTLNILKSHSNIRVFFGTDLFDIESGIFSLT